MANVLLHIGRHKTGTTALQQAFIASREALFAAGIDYPRHGLEYGAHHLIAEAVHLHSLQKGDAEVARLLRDFRAEIDRAPTPWILVSSEGFQRCRPDAVARLFTGHQVWVTIYLRDPLSYLQSAYLQEVQASTYAEAIEGFAVTEFEADYQDFYDHWAKVFGVRNILVRIFHPNLLRDGDIVSDFLTDLLPALVGKEIRFQKPAATTDSRNPSLSGAWIPFKLRLNRMVATQDCPNFNLYRVLGRLSAAMKTKDQLVSPSLERHIRAKYAASHSELLQKLGYPPHALDRQLGPSTSYPPMGPQEFYSRLTALLAEEPTCGLLREECYHACIATTPYYHALILSRHLREDHLPLMYLERPGRRAPFLQYFRQAGPWYVAAREHFDPEADGLVADFGDGLAEPITLRPGPLHESGSAGNHQRVA